MYRTVSEHLMTATIKPPSDEEVKSRPIRFSSMESLGFSNPSSIWSDSTTPETIEFAPSAQDTVADWRPGEFETQLTGGDFRLGVFLTSLILVVGVAAGAFWLYQRPAADATASNEVVVENARQLESSLGGLETFNADLAEAELENDMSLLFAADSAARALFDASGDLPESASDTRSAAAAASSATLDGVRLAGDAHTYRLAVWPMLAAPELETDPSLIELDEAARTFGDWQLRFDDVRTALPDSVMPDVTAQLDVLSGDLSKTLSGYVDALRQNDSAGADAVLGSLSTRLDVIRENLDSALIDTRSRVEQRVAEARAEIQSLLADRP